jgi:hypothetical protein
MNDAINPKHYKSHPSGIECIDITEHLMCNRANAIKYAWRAENKGAHLQDLNKCVWYLEREIERIKKTNEPSFHACELDAHYDKLYAYYKEYEFDKRLIAFIESVIFSGEDGLSYAIKIVNSWIRELGQ